jgi:hypothetical protein
VEIRKALVEGGAKAIGASDDALIQFARLADPELRRIRERDEEIAEVEKQAYAQIAEAQFAVEGTNTYPDATFSLRLAFGVVKGYREDGDDVPPWTTMGGAFDHQQKHGAEDPWVLPASWHAARDRIPADQPFNFVCTADIIGGNSGSPVINRQGELVGLIFDGNIQSLTANYFYSEDQARAVAVNAGAIREALRHVYGADELVEQLGR